MTLLYNALQFMTIWTLPCFNLKEPVKEEEQVLHSFYAHLKLNALPRIISSKWQSEYQDRADWPIVLNAITQSSA